MLLLSDTRDVSPPNSFATIASHAELWFERRIVRPNPRRFPVIIPVMTIRNSVIRKVSHKFLVFQFSAVGIFDEPNLRFEVVYDFESAQDDFIGFIYVGRFRVLTTIT